MWQRVAVSICTEWARDQEEMTERTAEREPLYTIGHSTREIGEFIALLRGNGIANLVDIRRYPGSRRYPQFGSESLKWSLEGAGITYRHAPELGGRRSPAADSPNTAWRNLQFRGYADYAATPEFQDGLERLIRESAASRTSVMCAEAVPWRCHRMLLADNVVARGIEVFHIIGPGEPKPHTLNPRARRGPEGELVYAG